MPDFDLTAQGFRLPHFHKLSKKQVLLLYLIDASETHPVFFVRNRRRTYLFELVFSMTASSECRVSHVFSAFMRKAAHISAGEDRVLLRPPKNGENGENEGQIWLITGGPQGGKGGRPFASKKILSFLRKPLENSGFRLYMKWAQKKRPELGRWRIRWWSR